MTDSIGIQLQMRGRELYMESGKGYEMSSKEDGVHIFGVNSWLYEFHESEFPAYQWIRDAEERSKQDPSHALEEIPPHVLNEVLKTASDALSYFD